MSILALSELDIATNFSDWRIMTCIIIHHHVSIIDWKICCISVYRKNYQGTGQKILPCPAIRAGQGRATFDFFALPWNRVGQGAGQGRAGLPCDGLWIEHNLDQFIHGNLQLLAWFYSNSSIFFRQYSPLTRIC